jgi:hypothetical protein
MYTRADKLQVVPLGIELRALRVVGICPKELSFETNCLGVRWQIKEWYDRITWALAHALATLGFLAWAGNVISLLFVSCLGCNLFGELFSLVVPLVLAWS